MFSNNRYRSILSDYKSLVLSVIKLPKLMLFSLKNWNSILSIVLKSCIVRLGSLEHVHKNYYTMVSFIASIDTMIRLKLENLSIVMQ